MNKINRLTIRSAEAMAVDLSERGEKHAAGTIASLLAIIEDLAPKEQDRAVMFGVDVATLHPGSRIDNHGRTGTVTYVDTKNIDRETGFPVVLVDWDEDRR